MKKLFLVTLIVLINFSVSYSYVLQEFTANEGLSYLKANVAALSSKKLIFMQAAEMKGYPETKVNFSNGTAYSWQYAFKSNDTSDKIGYIYIIDKPDGIYDFNSLNDTQTDY